MSGPLSNIGGHYQQPAPIVKGRAVCEYRCVQPASVGASLTD